DFQGILAAFLGDRIERAVNDALGNRLLALAHQYIDELGNVAARIFRVGQDLALGNLSASGHGALVFRLGWVRASGRFGFLRAVLGAPLLAVLDAGGV